LIALRQLGNGLVNLERPEYFRVGYYKPRWDAVEAGYVHYGEFILPANLWCVYLKQHKIWVICGQVTTCSRPSYPVGGVTVKAYDVDWIQSDSLGGAITDMNGHFMIYYERSKFIKTPFSPFINVEWTGGPDLYFIIEGTDTEGNPVPLLKEDPSRGRKPDRENVSNCFCVKLCVEIGTSPANEVPMWTHIGNYQVPDSSNMHDFTTEGYTLVGDLAFCGQMEFIGQTGMATATKKLRYRFRYAEWTSSTVPTPDQFILGDMMAELKVGQIITSISPLTLEPVYVNKPSAAHNHQPDSKGWIEVEDNPNYTPVGNKLIALASRNFAPYESNSNPAPNPDAGNPAVMSNARKIRKFAIRYELQEKIDLGAWTSVYDQTMEALVINNADTLLWLELKEFIDNSTLCQPIVNTLTVQYTADHPHLSWYEVEVQRQGAHQYWPVPRDNYGGSITFRGGNGTTMPSIDVTGWPHCSYIVFLRAQRRLTDGYGSPSAEFVYRTFCKN
jgi:hypothetical protein